MCWLFIILREWLKCRLIVNKSKNFYNKQQSKGYPDNSPSGQFAPDNSPPIFKQLVPRSFIHYRTKRAAKYMKPRLNVFQIISRSFIHHRTSYSSFFYPLPSLKIGGELSGANCRGGELSDMRLKAWLN